MLFCLNFAMRYLKKKKKRLTSLLNRSEGRGPLPLSIPVRQAVSLTQSDTTYQTNSCGTQSSSIDIHTPPTTQAKIKRKKKENLFSSHFPSFDQKVPCASFSNQCNSVDPLFADPHTLSRTLIHAANSSLDRAEKMYVRPLLPLPAAA
jgi:hypothetical protein